MNNSATKAERIMLVVVSILLIYNFFQQLFFPETESPSAGLNFLTIVIDGMMVFSVVGLALRRLKSAPRPGEGAGPWLILPALGLGAGLGLFVIRLIGAGDGALPPRSPQSSTERSKSSEALTEVGQFGARLVEVLTPYSKAEAAIKTDSWAQGSREERQKLSRKHLQDFLARAQVLSGAIDKVIDLLKEPGFEVKLARLVSFSVGQGEAVAPTDIEVESWQLRRRLWTSNQKLWTLIDAHWEEWRTQPQPPDGELKPWQKELAEVEREVDVARNEFKAHAAAANVPAVEAPVVTQGRGRLAALVHDIRRQFGAARVLKEITITRDGVGLVVRDPQNHARTANYFRNYKSLAQEEDFSPRSYSLPGEGSVREVELFGVEEADWTRMPALTRAALEKIPLPAGRVVGVALVRRFHPLQENPAEWRVEVKNGGLLDGENGNAFFDAMSYELTELELPKSLMKSAAYLTPENTQALLANILQDFGPETRFTEFSIDDNRALLTATRPKHPDDLRRYGYTATERAKLGKHNPIPVQDPKARNGLFTAADVAGFVPQLDRLRQRAFERLKMKDGRVTWMAFWRQHMVHGTNKKLLLEMRCDSPTLGDGVVIYEMSGKEFYVALP